MSTRISVRKQNPEASPPKKGLEDWLVAGAVVGALGGTMNVLFDVYVEDVPKHKRRLGRNMALWIGTSMAASAVYGAVKSK